MIKFAAFSWDDPSFQLYTVGAVSLRDLLKSLPLILLPTGSVISLKFDLQEDHFKAVWHTPQPFPCGVAVCYL